MAKLLQFSARYPWPVLLILIALTALAATRLPDLRIAVTAESMAVEDDPAWIAQQTNASVFEDKTLMVVLIQDPHLFTPQKLKRAKALANELSALSQIAEQTSLFTVANIRLQGENVLTSPYLDEIPDSQDALSQILQQARLNPLVIDNLVNRDGTAMAINLALQSADNDPEFDHQLSQSVAQVLQRYRADFNHLAPIGSPIIRDAITQKISQDQRRIMPWSLLLLFFILALGVRQLGGALIPFFTAGVSIVWTLAGMAMLDIPLGVMTSIVPALLIIIGSTEDVHLISEFKSNRRRGMAAEPALQATSRAIGVAILLTFVTTWFGFFSIVTNEIRLLQEFGLVASTGLLVNFLVTRLSVPAMLKISSRDRPSIQKALQPVLSRRKTLFNRLALLLFRLSRRHARLTVMLLTAISLISLYGASQLRVNHNPLGYFDDQAEVVQNSYAMHQWLSGIQTFSILLETGIEDTFQKVRYLQEIEKIQQYLASRERIDKTNSLADFIKLVHVVMEEDEVSSPEQLYLPDDDSLVREYMLFIKPELVKSYVNPAFDQSRIVVRHDIRNSSELRQEIDLLQHFIEQNIDPALRIQVTGSSVVQADAAEYLASGQFKSLLLMGLVIIVVVAVLFINWKAGVVALIPNLFPVIILFGVMGFGGIALDTGTAMVAVIALGICVDDTVHFMTRYHHNTRNRSDTAAALEDTVLDESEPVITTSLALMAGFMTFSLSSFTPIEYFGLLSALVILVALLTTFVITPLLLSYVELVTMWDMLSLKLQAQVVNDCPLFRDLSAWQIKQAILASEVKQCRRGESIIEQGSIGDEMYVILEGSVSVKIRQESGSVITVSEIDEGGLFGEIALVSKIPRTAAVIAAKDCRLLTLRWESIERFARFHTRTASRLFKNLASIVGSRLTRLENLTVLRDEYSGAVNRNILQELIDLEIRKSQRFQEPVTFICFTIHLSRQAEKFNDLISHLSLRIRNETRYIDVYGRWGDRRFVIVLTRTEEAAGKEVGARIERMLAAEIVESRLAGDYKMTVWSYDGKAPELEFKARMEQILNAPAS